VRQVRTEHGCATVDDRFPPLLITTWHAQPDAELLEATWSAIFEALKVARDQGRRLVQVVDLTDFGGMPKSAERVLLAAKADEQDARYDVAVVPPWFLVMPSGYARLITIMEWLMAKEPRYRVFTSRDEALREAIAHGEAVLGARADVDPGTYEVKPVPEPSGD
jgi:hypothetical protein